MGGTNPQIGGPRIFATAVIVARAGHEVFVEALRGTRTHSGKGRSSLNMRDIMPHLSEKVIVCSDRMVCTDHVWRMLFFCHLASGCPMVYSHMFCHNEESLRGVVTLLGQKF